MVERDLRSLVANLKRRQAQKQAQLGTITKRAAMASIRRVVDKAVPPPRALRGPVCDTCSTIGGHHPRCAKIRRLWNGVGWWLAGAIIALATAIITFKVLS